MDGQPPPDFPEPPAQQPSVTASWGSPRPLPPPPPPLGGTSRDRPFSLQPMGVGELIDAAIKLYRSQWKRLMAIVAIALVPITFLQVFITRSLGTSFSTPSTVPEDVDTTLIAGGVVALLEFLVVQPFLTAAMAKASADVYLGHPVLVGPTFKFAVSRIHSILWISILSGLAILLGFVLLIVPGVILLVRWFFGSTVFVIEGRKGSKALGRSWGLAQGHFWKVLGTFLLASIMAAVVQGILSIPGEAAFAAIGPAGWPLYAIGLSLAAILTAPFTTLIAVLLYFDLRIRKEAFDLEIMAREMSSQQ
jgi:hypothetical protein